MTVAPVMQSLGRGATVNLPATILGLADILDDCTARLGPHHPETLATVNALAIAFWCAGDTDQATSLLEQALKITEPFLERHHPVCVDLLTTLGEIMVEQDKMDHAAAIYREVLELCVRRSGPDDPATLAAKGDLSLVLFELGDRDRAIQLENQACESAGTHLGKSHPVSCVLAWNRVRRHEREGDAELARSIVVENLAWMLTADHASLAEDQEIIRVMLAEQFGWDVAALC